ncbi:hypothetical protein FBEOM_11009 [Fusarium beomiforme]|uniref:Uncharacterized protein n=1 Tax=Fusarium beomiforme TaxID=44412 RepID=A0A9P5AAT6_9HYPO|nr:hypothetical protein FBEOM_11009 [Fusarium beomiforme]
MSMILAPYNDAMRIGQGFNSYSEHMTIVVSYSARAVEKLSDIIQTMNVSYPHSIKKGSVTVSGSNAAIDEGTFKSADINIIVTVKVTNQTTLIKSNTRFVPMKGIDPGSQMFNEAYGDSYISGFIEGGEFTGIISIKVIDRSNVDLTVKRIKARLDAKDNSSATEFTLNSHDSFSSRGSASVMENTESHIHVSWMGGGQIKNVSSYTAELFDSYMDYKILLKYVQLIIDDPESYEAVDKNALDTSIDTLLGVRFAMRKEQSKIIEAISVLSRDPEILARQGGWVNGRYNEVLNRLLSKTANYSADKPKPATQKDSISNHEDSNDASASRPESFDFSALLPAEVWRKWMPVPKPVSSGPSANKTSAPSKPLSVGASALGPPPSDDLDWNKNSDSKASKHASLLQEQLDALNKDLERKVEEHKESSKSFQVEIAELKEKHKLDLEAIAKRQSDYDILKAGEKTASEETLQRLEKERNEAVEAARKEEQRKYGVLRESFDVLEAQQKALVTEKANEIQSLRNEKQTALEKLGKDKDLVYKALEESYKTLKETYESLKKQQSDLAAEKVTLTTNNNNLAAEKVSLMSQLQEKNTAYNNLKALYDPLKTAHDALVLNYNTLKTEKGTVDGDKNTLKTMMQWAGLSENSKMENCLPYGYSGWTVMIMMPHSRMALNSNKWSHDMAHAWSFDMGNADEIFKLEKANDHPTTPWTITNIKTGKLLVFLNGATGCDVRVREKNSPEIEGRSAYWYIGRGAPDRHTTWVLKNAQ